MNDNTDAVLVPATVLGDALELVLDQLREHEAKVASLRAIALSLQGALTEAAERPRVTTPRRHKRRGAPAVFPAATVGDLS